MKDENDKKFTSLLGKREVTKTQQPKVVAPRSESILTNEEIDRVVVAAENCDTKKTTGAPCAGCAAAAKRVRAELEALS